MTITEAIVTGTIGIVVGAAATYYFMSDDSDHLTATPVGDGITYEEAKVYVDNYQLDTGRSNFFFLSDEILSQLDYVKDAGYGGDGFVIYFGAVSKMDDYDATVIARVSDITTPDTRKVIDKYTVFDNSSRMKYGICPYTCDKELNFTRE